MLYYALLFLVVALIAGFFGFGGIAFRGRRNCEDSLLCVPGHIHRHANHAPHAWRYRSRLAVQASQINNLIRRRDS